MAAREARACVAVHHGAWHGLIILPTSRVRLRSFCLKPFADRWFALERDASLQMQSRMLMLNLSNGRSPS